MARPYLESTIIELEDIVSANKHSRPILGEVREELEFRKTDRAKRLLRDVEGLLSGEVKMPKRELKPDGPENQLELDEL